MIEKENAIVEMAGWLKAAKTALGLDTVARTPSSPVDNDRFPAVFIHEGDDAIIKYSSTRTGYPVVRRADVVFEMWAGKSVDIRALHQAIRTLLFSSRLTTAECDIRETKTFGPFNGGIPHTRTMQLIIGLTYKDAGPTVS